MSARQSTGDDRVRLFWDNFLIRIHKKGITPPFDQWYVRRAEEYIAASQGIRLGAQKPSDVESFLREAGRKPAGTMMRRPSVPHTSLKSPAAIMGVCLWTCFSISQLRNRRS